MLASLLLAVTLPSAAALVPQDPAEEFRNQYQQALELNDKKAIDGLLRKYKAQAVADFINNADARAAQPSDSLNRWVDSFIDSWQRTQRSSFARNYDRFLQLMNDSTRRNRAEILTKNLPIILQLHATALEQKTKDAWDPVRQECELVVPAMKQIGDQYYLAVLLYVQGNAYNGDLSEGEGSDDQRALDLYAEYLTVRDALGLTNDQEYETVEKLAGEMRAKLGVPDPETGEVGERKVSRFEIQPAEGAEWVEVPLEFEADEDLDGVAHPNDLADDHRLSWRLAGTHEVGTEVALYPYDPPVKVQRIEFGKFVVDGGAGPSEEFKLMPKPVTVPFQRKLADGRVIESAIRVAGGIDRDMYHGAELNLSVNDGSATVFYRSVATVTGDTPFGPVTLYDLDGDGAYGVAEPALVGAHGMPKETWLYRYDAVMLGKGKHSQPFSRYITDGKGAWFELKVPDMLLGDKLQLLPVAPKLGTVEVKMKGLKGVKLSSLVLAAETSQIKGTYIDVMVSKSGKLELPIGRYRFVQGLARGSKGAEALILPGVGLGLTIDVEEGTTSTIELGAPFSLTIEARVEGRKLFLDGETLCVVGNSGERYCRIVGEPLFGVEVSLKGEKAEGELRGSTAEEVMAHWPLAYMPQSLELELKGSEKPPMRMTLKKHPWFGKIDTGWVE